MSATAGFIAGNRSAKIIEGSPCRQNTPGTAARKLPYLVVRENKNPAEAGSV